MKILLGDPLRVLLTLFSFFAMWRSLISIVTAFQDESSPWRSALIYLLLIVGLFIGSYLVLQNGTAGDAGGKGEGRSRKDPDFTDRKLIGTLLLAVSLSLLLGAWFGPYLRPGPLAPTSTPTGSPTPVRPASQTPIPHTTSTSTPSPTANPAPSATLRPTRIPDGVKMEIIVARVHVRQSPTSQSPSRGELNNGDWIYFDAQAYDAQGTLWLRIGRDQDDADFKPFSGLWIFAGGVHQIGLEDLPLLPATATPSG